MARTDVATTKVAIMADFAQPAGVAVDQPNGMRIVFGGVSGSSAGGKARRVLVRITNTAGATKVVTVPRNATGVQDPPASDFATAAIAATTGDVLIMLSAKYIQADGTWWLNFVAGHTGIVSAYELPAGG